MLPAGHHHFRGRAEMPPAAALFLRMRVPQERQGADALQDVVFLPVIGGGVVDGRAGHRWKTADVRARRETIESARKQFRQTGVRADRDQSFGQAAKFSEMEGAALLIGHRSFIHVRGGALGMMGEQTTEIMIARRRLDVQQHRLVIQT